VIPLRQLKKMGAFEHPDKVRAEYSIGEIGGFPMEMDGKRFYLIQVAQKGACWLRIITQGHPGHGSIPDENSALIRAAEITATLGGKQGPQHNVESVTRFINQLSTHLAFPKKLVFRQFLNPTLSDRILGKMIPQKDLARALAAMLHDTATPRCSKAGTKQILSLPRRPLKPMADYCLIPGNRISLGRLKP
jgi:hypothetical protein